MTLDVAQSAALLIIATLAIALLLRILMIVHKQNNTVKELQMRMKAMEKLGTDPETLERLTNDTKKG